MEYIATAVCLMFAFTAANHLGLIGKIEEIINHPLPVINCPMCSTFWSTLIYMLVSANDVIGAVAMSFLFAYMATWLELAMCVVDHFYKKIYETIIPRSATDKIAECADDGHTPGALSKLRKK